MDYVMDILMLIALLIAFYEIYRFQVGQKKLKFGFYAAIVGIWFGIVEMTFLKNADHTVALLMMSFFLVQLMWFYKNKGAPALTTSSN